MRSKIVDSARGFVRRNQKAIVYGTIAVSVIVLQHKGIKSMSEFLEDKGLYEEYFHNNEV